MALRLKTVEYSFPLLDSIANTVDTALTSTTLYLPEATKTFHSVVLTWSCLDNVSAAANITRRQVTFGLGAAATTVVNNTQTLGNSGENIAPFFTIDLTSYFAANWSGTSMSASCSVLLTQTSGSQANSVTLTITYEFDDAAASHLKTVYVPFDSLAAGINNTSTAVDTVPLLDTFCPESGKVFRDAFLVVEGNSTLVAGTTDVTFAPIVGGVTQAAATFKSALISDVYFRTVWKLASATTGAPTFSTAATQALAAITNNATAKFHHVTFTLVVTYEFDPAATTTVLNSVLLPLEMDSPQSYSLALAAQQERDLWVQEASPTLQRSAFRLHFEHANNITGFNLAVQNQSYKAYTVNAAVVCGGNALQRVFTSADMTFTRGRNSLVVRHYCTSTTNFGSGLCGVWIVNYTSAKHAQGVWAHNHTVRWGLLSMEAAAPVGHRYSSAFAPVIPETSSFRTSVGIAYGYMTLATATPGGVALTVEVLASETGGLHRWESVYADVNRTDPEVGWHPVYGTVRDLFRRWTSDPDPARVSLTSARLWRTFQSNANQVFDQMDLMATYHSITYTVAGTVSGYTGDGSGLTVNLHRASTGEKVLVMTTTAGGAFTGLWFDNTEQLYAEVFQDATHVGRSAPALVS